MKKRKQKQKNSYATSPIVTKLPVLCELKSTKVLEDWKVTIIYVSLHFYWQVYRANVQRIWIFKFDLFHVEITPFSAFILDFNEFKKTKGSKFSYAALQLKHYIYVLACC